MTATIFGGPAVGAVERRTEVVLTAPQSTHRHKPMEVRDDQSPNIIESALGTRRLRAGIRKIVRLAATTERRAGSYGHLTGIVSAARKLLCRCAILDGEVAPSAEA